MAKSKFTNEEDERIFNLVKIYNFKWRKISKFFMNRTYDQIKFRGIYLFKKKKK
jgi:hypothetical protein